MDYIRKRILQIINEQGVTQKELSERSGVPYISLNRFLANSGNSVGIETLLRIASGLNMPIELLIAQRKVNSSMLFDTVEFKINQLSDEKQKQFLISINNILDIMISKNNIR